MLAPELFYCVKLVVCKASETEVVGRILATLAIWLHMIVLQTLARIAALAGERVSECAPARVS